jgi:hypothetical protein
LLVQGLATLSAGNSYDPYQQNRQKEFSTGLQRIVLNRGLLNQERCRPRAAGRGAKMKEEERDFLYALIGDTESERRLKDFVFYYGLRLALREHWKIENSDIIKKMSETAVQEILHRRCRSCSGTWLDRKFRARPRCSSLGLRRLSDRMLSEKIGVEHRHFIRLWQHRYDCLFVFVEDIQGSVVSQVRQSRNWKAVLLA